MLCFAYGIAGIAGIALVAWLAYMLLRLVGFVVMWFCEEVLAGDSYVFGDVSEAEFAIGLLLVLVLPCALAAIYLFGCLIQKGF
jgi:hypothetical protein